MLAAAVPSDLSNFLRSIEVVSVALRMKAECFNIQFWKVWPPPGLASLHAGSVSARGPFLSPFMLARLLPTTWPLLFPSFPSPFTYSAIMQLKVPSSEKPPCQVNALLEVSMALGTCLPPTFPPINVHLSVSLWADSGSVLFAVMSSVPGTLQGTQ